MHDSARLHKFNSHCELSNVLCNVLLFNKAGWLRLPSCNLLLKPPHALGLLLPDELIEFLSRAVLHEQVNVLLILKEVVQLHDVGAL